jgi:regulatory protein
MKENNSNELFKRMAALCSRSEQCSGDIHKKITAAGLTGNEAVEIIEKLIAEKFINDERYAKAYVSDKFRMNKWGKIKIRHYLKAKGLPNNLIQSGLDTIDEAKYRQALLKTMKEKARVVKKKPRYEKMGQIIRFAQNRGFEPELIHRYLNEVLE